MNDREQFFYDHAGWSYLPGAETPEQGRERCAIDLARAELAACEQGFWFSLETDPYVMPDDVDSVGTVERGEAVNLSVAAYNSEGEIVASLGGIVVVDRQDPYLRVVRAELASEAIAEGELTR